MDRAQRVAWPIVVAAMLSWAAALALDLAGVRGLRPPPIDVCRLPHGGSPLERMIAGDSRHHYSIYLRKGEFVQVRVEQRGVDLVVDLFAPWGLSIEIDSPNGRFGTERLAFIAPRSSLYLVSVRPLNRGDPGEYTISLEPPRSPDKRDALRAKGTSMFARAERRQRSGAHAELAGTLAQYACAAADWQAAGEDVQVAMALRRLGDAHVALGDPRAALASLDAALAAVRRTHDSVELARTLNQAGTVWHQLGDVARATDLHEQALLAARQARDPDSEALALTYLGLLHEHFGRIQAALDRYEQALPLWRSLRDREWESTTLQHLASAYNFVGRVDDAEDLLERAARAAPSVDGSRTQAVALASLGWLRYTQGRPNVALPLFDKALGVWDSLEDERGKAGGLDRRGSVLAALNRFEEALASYEASLAISRRLGSRAGVAHTLMNLGRAHLARRMYATSAACYQQAIDAFRQLRDDGSLGESLVGLARAERQSGRLEAAREHLAEARRLIAEQRAHLDVPSLRALHVATRLTVHWDSIDLLMEMHAAEPGRGFDVEAFSVHENSRARGLLERLAAAPPASSAWTAADRQRLHDALSAHDRRRRWLETHDAGKDALAREERDMRAALLEFDKLDRGRHRPVAPLSLQAIQEHVLDDDTLLVQYALTQDHAYAWVVGRHFLVGRKLRPRREIEFLAERTYSAMAQSRRQASAALSARIAARQLSDALLRPICHFLGGRRLLIVSDGLLQYVPFGALPMPDCGDPDGVVLPLLVKAEVVSLPSVSIVPFLRRPRGSAYTPAKLLAMFADPVLSASDARLVAPRAGAHAVTRDGPVAGSYPDYASESPDLPPLRHVRREALAILDLVPRRDAFVALGFAASRASLLALNLSDFRILHFATHGVFNEDHPELSSVALSMFDATSRPAAGFLYSREIAEFDLATELVVLSACRTALGERVDGEGLLGLSRAFLGAGARRLVVSLWDVDDATTADLMERFYTAMIHGRMAPAAALRAAQLAQREKLSGAPAGSYEWVAFVLQGDWR